MRGGRGEKLAWEDFMSSSTMADWKMNRKPKSQWFWKGSEVVGWIGDSLRKVSLVPFLYSWRRASC